MKAIYKVWSVENPESVYYFNDFSEVENKVNEIQSTGVFASWDFMDDSEEPTTPAPIEFSELTHAGQCLDIYLMNTADIYERYTVQTIESIVSVSSPSDCGLWVTSDDLTEWESVKNAVQAAARLVRKFDGLNPTASDIRQVTRNYAEYIVDCAKSEILETVAL